MLRSPSSSRLASRRGIGSALAIALALAGGSMVVNAALPSPAYAQKKPSYSRDFVKVYQPVSTIVNTEGGDLNAARAQLPAVYAAVKNDDDKSAAGNLTLILGNKLSDAALQRQGLDMMLASGKVAPEQVGQFQFVLGNLAYQAKDYAAARTALQAAVAAGYTQDNTEALILESYFQEGNVAGGIGYLEQRAAAGQAIPENWLLRGLQNTYDNEDMAGSLAVSDMLLRLYPTAGNWQKSLQVIYTLGGYEAPVMIDVLRLMRLTDSMKERREYVSYVQAADERIMANEVLGLLAEGLTKGEFTASDQYYLDVKRVADTRAPVDRRDVAGMATEGRNSRTGAAAHNAGEVYLSLGSWAEAEEMYKLALEKGVEDPNRTLTRLGIVQLRAGKLTDADATFSRIEGTRAPVAAMWKTYIATKS